MEQAQKFLEALKKIPRDLYLPIGLGCIGLILFTYGLITYFKDQQQAQIIPEQHITAEITPVKTVKSIVVDIEGAVLHPGVYAIDADSRMQDGLIVAGGLSALADRDYVAQRINLATKLADGQKIYIPRIGENILEAGASVSTNALSDNSNGININTASESDLDGLPGVGPVTAQKIITNRPYQTVQDLLSKKVVSQKVFDEIQDKVSAF